jgi:hypothetical protein
MRASTGTSVSTDRASLDRFLDFAEHVTLSDGTTATVYQLAGASWFGGNFSEVNGKFEFTDTEFFNIIAPGGGVVAKVAGVEHMAAVAPTSPSASVCVRRLRTRGPERNWRSPDGTVGRR